MAATPADAVPSRTASKTARQVGTAVDSTPSPKNAWTASSLNAPGSPWKATAVKISARTTPSCRARPSPGRARPAAPWLAGAAPGPLAVAGRLRRARPVLLGEQQVDRLDVGVDRRRDDVRAVVSPV